MTNFIPMIIDLALITSLAVGITVLHDKIRDLKKAVNNNNNNILLIDWVMNNPAKYTGGSKAFVKGTSDMVTVSNNKPELMPAEKGYEWLYTVMIGNQILSYKESELINTNKPDGNV